MCKKLFVAFLVVLCSAHPAHAAGFESELARGYAHLRAGDTEEALNVFRGLLTDQPDSDLVKYSIAGAQQQRALQLLQSGEAEQGNAVMAEAQGMFNDLGASANPAIRENAALNWANGITSLAQGLDPVQQYNERVQALQQAVSAYESVLQEHPKLARAEANLDHARYELKRMLQQPPPDQERSEDSESGEQGEEQQEQEQQPGEQEQDDEQEQEPSDEEQEGDPSEDESETTGDPSQQSPTQPEENPLNDQNIEAILESLEERDREAQKELRRARGVPQVRNGKWW